MTPEEQDAAEVREALTTPRWVVYFRIRYNDVNRDYQTRVQAQSAREAYAIGRGNALDYIGRAFPGLPMTRLLYRGVSRLDY